MPKRRTNPTYSAWVPVKLNYLQNDIDLDPFRPYFGESKTEMEKAEDAYRKMLDDASHPQSAQLVSDGQFDPNGDLVPRHSDSFHSLSARRLRASQRHAIVTTIRQRGSEHDVLKQLSVALRIPDTRRVLHAYHVALAREDAHHRRISRRRARLQKEHAIFNALDFPKPQTFERHRPHTDFAQNFFCFKCFIFGCQTHAGEHVLPIRPIPDDTIAQRVNALSTNAAAPCSARCFLLEEHLQPPQSAEETRPWSDEEIMLLRHACTLTHEDPCAMAIVVGSKSCRQVRARISNLHEKHLLTAAIKSAKQNTNKTTTKLRSKKKRPEPANSHIQRVRRRQELKSPDKSNYGREGDHHHHHHHDDDDPACDSHHAAYVPCNHSGACSKANGCSCLKDSLYCESTCCCNTGRFSNVGAVIRWDPQSEGYQGSKRPPKCKNRHWGCSCRSGYCNTNSCECFRDNRVCNPDFCTHCEADILPHYISVYERRCRNTELITARHKRTVAGKSNVHGFGLFALDYFDVGDLIGHYCGRTVHPEKVDFLLRASDAKKLTYAFDLTGRMTIDGACFGSKVRLINHSSNPGDVNCGARLERVRGEARIAIKALKTVKPGDEFLFDYKITQGNEWLDQDSAEGSVFDSDADDSPGKHSQENSSAPRFDITQPMRALNFAADQHSDDREEDDVEIVASGRRDRPRSSRRVEEDIEFVGLNAENENDAMDSDSTTDCPVIPIGRK
eukprot:gb/GEZJ01001987.1/.p1 GENE.gb/GEZJ01001987.1/~~gb/GEZJ01001987.1/.p1  ORF type:complete len:800 (-),score=120.47 gb/GEZJ01001987.1/:1347-3536(-)